MEQEQKSHNMQGKKKNMERILGAIAILTIIVAWFIGGAIRGSSFEHFLPQAFPQATSFERLDTGIYAALADDSETIIGYVASGTATGYGGPMEIAVGVDLNGNILGFAIVDTKETPSYLEKVFRNSFAEDFIGKSYSDQFELGDDIDGVTSATYTSTAITQAIKEATQKVASEQLGQIIVSQGNSKIIFGVPEIVLVLLFAAGYLGRRRVVKQTKVIRWATMLTGMVVLGFIFNRPLTISKINMFLLGYWPDWHSNLYWYILLGGIIFVFTADNRNPYCEWFCPFGAAQECMGAIGGAKPRFSRDQQNIIDWLQRGLAWFAIVVALLLRNPGVSSYEIFGSLFQLNGTMVSFALLGLVLLTSLVVHRFWCRVLCPMRPVEGFIRMTRGWIIGLWQRKNKTAS